MQSAKPRGLYSDALRRMLKDRFATACFFIVVLYVLIALLAKCGQIAADSQVDKTKYSPAVAWVASIVGIAQRYNEEDGPSYERPSWIRCLELPSGVQDSESTLGAIWVRATSFGFWKQAFSRFFERESWKFPMGTDFLGRDVYQRILHGSRIAISVGLISSLIAIPIGVFFGAIAGYYGGKIDELIVWLYSTVSSVPDLLLILTACMVMGKGLTAVYISIGMTTWVTLARLIRAEFMKHKQRDYVVAAKALGAGDARCIFVHILPNVFHIVIINLSLRFVAAIKTEVILSYLGVGAQGDPSWGVMINDAKQELMRGVWWQLAGATLAMFFIVLALSIFADALRDALDPKLKT